MDGLPDKPVLAACGLAFEAAIAAGPAVVTVSGPGPGRLLAALEALLGAPPAAGLPPQVPAPRRAVGQDWAGIISFGCAGALDPSLAAGDCVLATGVLTADGVIPADPDWLRALSERLPWAREGQLAGRDAALVSVADKARLWRDSGACAVDMESHAAALAARRYGLPFAACRVVLDPAWRGVPSCALAGIRDDGTSALLPVLRALGTAPGELVALCALALDARLARRSLRRVRARLGPALAGPGWLPRPGAAGHRCP